MQFGLICEGPTDHAAIENMLCGIYDNCDLFESITQLQPGGATDSNQEAGWLRVFEYIKNYKFRQSLSIVKNVVIQIDTDVAYLKGFDVDLRDENGKALKCPIEIFEKVKNRLIQQINSGETGFYDNNSDRIIFAITVHSLEIWLFKHHSKNLPRVTDINSGEVKLASELAKNDKLISFTRRVQGKKRLMDKNYENYDKLTENFFNKKTRKKSVEELCKVDNSFRLFKEQL